jgi:tRNA1(Val) A37 N6-methylase TrmN6
MFDVVVGNPPYINISKIKSKNYLKDKFKVNGNADVGTLFYRIAYDYLHDNGVVCYVTSNKWLGSLSGTWVRKFVKENFRIVRIVNTYRVRLFETHMEVCVVLALKERCVKDYDIEVRMLRPGHSNYTKSVHILYSRPLTRERD